MRVRLNLIIERDEDDWVYRELASVPKGPKRIAKAKRMLHVAALIQRGLLQPSIPTTHPGPPPPQTASGRAGPSSATEQDIDEFFAPGEKE